MNNRSDPVIIRSRQFRRKNTDACVAFLKKKTCSNSSQVHSTTITSEAMPNAKMTINRKEIFVCLFAIVFGGLLYCLFKIVGLDPKTNSSWVYKLMWNVLGYSVIFIPGYLIINYLKRTNYIDELNKGCLWPLLKQCIYGREDELSSTNEKSDLPSSSLSFTKSAILLVYCFVGLQVSYLTWGLLQEKIMTQPYSGVKFTDSQFLVFVNRIFGLIIASVYINFYEKYQRISQPPLYKYSYCAFSNIMSSWFQYEALKFVSFPTQVLAKASKIIPVMLMGKLISKRTYEFYEYLTAGLISLGMFLFLTGNADSLQVEKHGSEEASTSSTFAAGLSGIIILVLYMVFDSFTSNWQSELFRTYRVSSCRMMAGVNLFSFLLTGLSLLQQGTMSDSTSFLFNNSDFAMDCLILSICSAVGQLFIYYTIEKFGAVVFIIIMTIRQAIAVILSCIFYHHPITAVGIIGVFVVFVSIFLRIYCSYRLKQVRKKGSIQILASSSSASMIKI